MDGALGLFSAGARGIWNVGAGVLNVALHPRQTADNFINGAQRVAEIVLSEFEEVEDQICEQLEGMLKASVIGAINVNGLPYNIAILEINGTRYDLRDQEAAGNAQQAMDAEGAKSIKIISILSGTRLNRVERESIQVGQAPAVAHPMLRDEEGVLPVRPAPIRVPVDPSGPGLSHSPIVTRERPASTSSLPPLEQVEGQGVWDLPRVEPRLSPQPAPQGAEGVHGSTPPPSGRASPAERESGEPSPVSRARATSSVPPLEEDAEQGVWGSPRVEPHLSPQPAPRGAEGVHGSTSPTSGRAFAAEQKSGEPSPVSEVDSSARSVQGTPVSSQGTTSQDPSQTPARIKGGTRFLQNPRTGERFELPKGYTVRVGGSDNPKASSRGKSLSEKKPSSPTLTSRVLDLSHVGESKRLAEKSKTTFGSAFGTVYDLRKWDKGLFLVRLAAWVGTVALGFIPLIGLWVACGVIDCLGKRKQVRDISQEVGSSAHISALHTPKSPTSKKDD